MFERIRDWLALRGRREHGGAFPTAPPEPDLTPEEDVQAREQIASAEHEPAEDS